MKRNKQISDYNIFNKKGATAVEYAIIASLIAAIIAGAVSTLGLKVLDLFQRATIGW